MQPSPSKSIAAGCSCYRFMDREHGGAEQLTAPTLETSACSPFPSDHTHFPQPPFHNWGIPADFIQFTGSNTNITSTIHNRPPEKKKICKIPYPFLLLSFQEMTTAFKRTASLYLRTSITGWCAKDPRWDVLQRTTRQLLMAESRAAAEATVLLEYIS